MRRLVFLASVSLCVAASLVILRFDTAAAESYYRRYDTLLRNYNLYGNIGLTYQRQWTDRADTDTETFFTQSYNLGLRGFVVDPRLVFFDVSGYFTKTTSDPGDDFTLLGQNVRVVFLQKLPQKWLSSWMYIPNPITLRFSHYANSVEYTNYGISLRYGKPYEWQVHEREFRQQTQGARKGNKENAENEENEENSTGANVAPVAPQSKGLGLNFPVTYFDYDHYDTKSQGESSSTNLYSLRSFMQGEVYDYRFYFEHENTTGISSTKRTLVQLEPNYRFFDPDTKRLLDIMNTLRYQTIDDQKTYEVHSRVNLYRPYGNDTLLGNGSLDYSRTSDKSSSSDVFNVNTTVSYNRVVSPRLSYMPYVSLGYGTSDDANSHFERVGTNVSVDLSRLFRSTSNVFAGTNQNGFEYGADAFLYTKTRISASLGYSFTSLMPDEGRAVTHRVVLNASGPIVGALSFNTYADYSRLDQHDPEDPFVEDSLRAGANLYWYFYRTSMSLGGSYAKVKRRNSITESSDVTTLTATLSRVITRNLLFTTYALWIRDSLHNKSLEITPRLQWSLRQTSVDVEYKYRRESVLGAPEQTEHRLTINFIRYFSRNFRM